MNRSLLRIALASRASATLPKYPVPFTGYRWNSSSPSKAENVIGFDSPLDSSPEPNLQKQKADADSNSEPNEEGDLVDNANLLSQVKDGFKRICAKTLTPVQAASIQPFLDSENGIVVRAKTGTGKTFAFGLPAVSTGVKNNLNHNNSSVSTIIISPTRDLTLQTETALSKLWDASVPPLKNSKQNNRRNNRRNQQRQQHQPRPSDTAIATAMGQTSRNSCVNQFRGDSPHIVVATPGRIIDLIENEPRVRKCMRNLENIVIDEADELLSGNFKHDIVNLIDDLKKNCLTGETNKPPKIMLFSATMNDDCMELAKRTIGDDFPYIDVTDQLPSVNPNIKQELIMTSDIFDSYVAAVDFLQQAVNANENYKAIVFVSTTVGVDFAYQLLSKLINFNSNRGEVLRLHGKMSQGERNRTQRSFRKLNESILIASNVAARGMDFPNVSQVLQIGPSHEVESYTHRIGRTGRAGKSGSATLILNEFEKDYISTLEDLGNTFVETTQYEPNEQLLDEARQIATVHIKDPEMLVQKILSSIRTIPDDVIKLDTHDVVRLCAEFYKEITGTDEKPPISWRVAQFIGLSKFRDLPKYFEVTGQKPSQKGGNRGGNRGGYRGGYRDGNRGGYRDSHRNGNRQYDNNSWRAQRGGNRRDKRESW